jgi:hypothetical protein
MILPEQGRCQTGLRVVAGYFVPDDVVVQPRTLTQLYSQRPRKLAQLYRDRAGQVMAEVGAFLWSLLWRT